MNHSGSSRRRMASGTSSDTILSAGNTCWRRELSHRFAVIIDAADYFRALKSAMIKAEKSIFLIGWDFDLRIHLDPGNKTGDWPDKLGDFINALVDRKPELEIRLLKWDLGAVKTLVRGATPLVLLGWMAKPRVFFRLDHSHPTGACHHQKIVVIDDAFAICGGINVTVGRWDNHNFNRNADLGSCRSDPMTVGIKQRKRTAAAERCICGRQRHAGELRLAGDR